MNTTPAELEMTELGLVSTDNGEEGGEVKEKEEMVEKRQMNQLLEAQQNKFEQRIREMEKKIQTQIDDLMLQVQVLVTHEDKEEEEVQVVEEEEIEILVDKKTGKRYSFNSTTGETAWVS